MISIDYSWECQDAPRTQIHRLFQVYYSTSIDYVTSLTTNKALDARRREATTEAYGAIGRKEERSLARLGRDGNPPEADKRSPSAFRRAVSLSNGLSNAR